MLKQNFKVRSLHYIIYREAKFALRRAVLNTIYLRCQTKRREQMRQQQNISFRVRTFKMELSAVVSASLLCIFNVAFMIAGIFLNSVVIISLGRSSQLRKKLCYFMIFVLSCYDLAVVAIMHPLQISSTISVVLGKYNDMQENGRFYIGFGLNAFSTLVLFVLNVERVLALMYPFFHQTSVTKRGLVFLLLALMLLCIILLSLNHLNYKIIANVKSTISIALFLLLFIYLNYKMFIIARSKRDNDKVAKSSNKKRKRSMFQFKTFSVCSLTVICYAVCLCPQLVYSVLRLTISKNTPHQELIFFYLWTTSVVCTNSTFNCLIFFWANSILRREGMNTVKRFRSAIFCRHFFGNDC